MAQSPKPLHEVSRPLSKSDLRTYASALDNLQGNILKGHGRERTAQIFLEFRAGKRKAVKRWIAKHAARVTPASRQFQEAREFKELGIPGTIFINVFLTAEGYKYLGFNPKEFGDASFQQGMGGARERLKDPKKTAWEKPYRKTVHAMILLADDGETFLAREARTIVDALAPVAKVLAIEHGVAIRNKSGETIEHFGYVDGRSQPLILESDVNKDTAKDWNPAAGPNLVLQPDPLGGENAFGSYFVFRKLEQDVRGFKHHEGLLATAMGLSGDRRELAGALAVGRFENGAPVVLDDEDKLPGGRVLNDFNYAKDPSGGRCPFHSHIRKTNPRGAGLEPLAEEKRHRIARRGITYGSRTRESFEEGKEPSGGVGLLFMCFQSDIAGQFEFMQQSWANNPNFARPATGVDPVIAQGSQGKPQQWPLKYGSAEPSVGFDFRGFVKMLGGEYFFAPSVSFLLSLGEEA